MSGPNDESNQPGPPDHPGFGPASPRSVDQPTFERADAARFEAQNTAPPAASFEARNALENSTVPSLPSWDPASQNRAQQPVRGEASSKVEVSADDTKPDHPLRTLYTEPGDRGAKKRDKSWLARAGERMEVVRKIVANTLVFAALLLLVFVIGDEVRKDPIVIKPFDVSRSLETDGYTGAILANMLVDQVNAFRRETAANFRRQNITLAAGLAIPDLKVPDAGVSLATIVDYVRRALRRTVREINGELRRDGETLVLTLRAAGGDTYKATLPATRPDSAIVLAAMEVVKRYEPYSLGAYLLSRGDTAGAMRMVVHALRDSPKDSVVALILRGQVLQVRQDYSGAASSYRIASEVDRDMPDALIAWGWMLVLQGNLSEGEARLREAARRDAHSLNLQYVLAELADQRGEYHRADSIYTQLANLDDQLAQVHRVWADALGDRRDFTRARQQYRIALDYADNGEDSLAIYNNFGQTFKAENELESADSLYEHATRVDSTDGVSWLNWCDNLRQQERYDEAIVKCETGLAVLKVFGQRMRLYSMHLPDDKASFAFAFRARFHTLLGMIYAAKGDARSARQSFIRAVAADAADPLPRLAFAEFCNQQKSYASADSAYAEAARLAPTSVTVFRLWGDALLSQGRIKEAAEKYATAVKHDPRSVNAQLSLARALLTNGKLDEAGKAIRAAIALEPKDPDMLTVLGDLLADQGDTAGARDAFRRAAESPNATGYPHLRLAQMIWGSNALTDSLASDVLAHTSRSVELSPSNAEAHYLYGLALDFRGRPEGMSHFQRAIALSTGAPKARSVYFEAWGNALSRQQKYDLAVPKFRAAIRLDPQNFEAHTGLGIALKRTGDFRGVADAFRAATRLHPKDPVPRVQLAIALFEQDMNDAAFREFELATRLAPPGTAVEADAYFFWGQALHGAGRNTEAKAKLRQAIALDSTNAEAYVYLGGASAETGDNEAARRAFRRVLTLQPRGSLADQAREALRVLESGRKDTVSIFAKP